MSPDGVLDASELLAVPAGAVRAEPACNDTLEEIERVHIRRVLDGTSWRIEGDHGAARRLGVNPSTLRGRMRKLGIRKTR